MDGHQVTIDNTRLHDNTGVEIVVTAKDGTVVTNTLLVRGFSCNSRLNIGRVDHEERVCYLLNTIAVKADHDYEVSDVVDLMNDQANWTVTWHSEHLRLIYAKRSPDNLTLTQLNQEANRIRALPWASRVEKETFATASGDNTETQEELGRSSLHTVNAAHGQLPHRRYAREPRWREYLHLRTSFQ